MSTKIIPFLLVIVVLLLTGCGGAAEAESADGRLQVVTTIGQIADAARIIGGDHVRVTSLMGAGTDPHLYVASISDVDKLRGADVVFYNGLYLEAQLEDVLEQLAERQSVVAVSAGIDPAGLMPSADYADEFDPHIWFDVALWSQAVAQVRDTLRRDRPGPRRRLRSQRRRLSGRTGGTGRLRGRTGRPRARRTARPHHRPRRL
jgi:manganese/zinc/iron transport system substrate-binding protein